MDPRHAALVSEIERLSGAIKTHRARGGGAPRARPYRNRSLAVGSDDWVHRRTAGSVSLENPAVFQQRARGAARPVRVARGAKRGRGYPRDTSVRRGERMGEVLVDGVTFVFDDSGTKLVKKSLAGESTPLHTSVNGEQYVRTKRGNLISRALIEQRRAARSTLCAYYTRTGACRRGDRCPYIHDAERVALCPGALKPSGCVNARCTMNHRRSAHNAPHCVHFLRSGTCRNGDACPYTHTPIAQDAPVCRDFARMGWCDAGRECDRRHAFECPDYEAGECRDKNCRLAHVKAPEPSPDVLFVRDDSGADDRYFASDVPESVPAPADDETGFDADFIALDESVASGSGSSDGESEYGEAPAGEEHGARESGGSDDEVDRALQSG